MIARDVEIVDINPAHWNNLQSILNLSNLSDRRTIRPKILSIIHKKGKILGARAPEGYHLPNLPQIQDPQELAKKLYDDSDLVDRVQIMEVESLGVFSDLAQKIDIGQSMDLDDFLLRFFHLLDQDPTGLSIYPPYSGEWNGFPLEKVREWFAQGPSPSAYFLGVIRDSAPWTSLILRVEAGKLRLITTIEYLAKYNLPADKLPSRPQDLKVICDAITAHVAPVRAAIICEYFVFSRLLSANDKMRVLQEAIEGANPLTTTTIAVVGLGN
jgi:hypothetical protein